MSRLSKIGAAALAAFGWTSGTSGVTVTYLVVAGGGGGGGARAGSYSAGGAGGAGGYQTGTTSLIIGTTYAVTVGAGGANGTSLTDGVNGGNSQLGALTASVGGGGGNYNIGAINGAGLAGGSGGGGGGAGPSTGGAGTSGQGSAGGGVTNNTGGAAGGGGAGAAAATVASALAGTAGGVGSANAITGASTYYAGGGGGGSYTPSAGAVGGLGGGGAGGANGVSGASGTANTGGGGGGGGGTGLGQPATNGGSGGSGVVIISYVGAQQFSGGVVTSVGGSTIHTFNTSGTLGVITSLTAASLVVAGGGGGGVYGGGGGGAGGLRTGSGITIDPNTIYVVTVGAGGAGATAYTAPGISGGNSTFNALTSAGGGGGGSDNDTSVNAGLAGGSGGGAALSYNLTWAGGAASPVTSPVQGYAGAGTTASGGSFYNASGGGGGAGAAGTTGSTVAAGGGYGNAGYGTSGNGGAGVVSSISGTSVTYAGGGGGGGASTGAAFPNSYYIAAGSGGSGGGGAGTMVNSSGIAGTANLGGGGGGGGMYAGGITGGGAGGSGVVIISYPGATQQMAGGIVTISGGNVIHTFNTSGYLTPITYYTKSLRFRSSASAYLTRTPATTTNQKTWTWSAWVKRGILGSSTQELFIGTSSGNFTGVRIIADQLYVQDYLSGSYNIFWTTTAVYRDPAAWYHVVISYDTTQASSTNAVSIWINGVIQAVSFSTALGAYVQNRTAYINTASTAHYVSNGASSNYFDGEMTAINFIDGQALAPTSFGTFNSYNQWQPITYGGSYGTNGFYLPFNSVSTSSYAGSFNGTSQRLNTSTAGITLGTNSFTVEGWINPTAVTGGIFYDIYASNAYNSGQITFRINSSQVLQFYYADGSTYFFSGTTIISPNKWYHVALVRTGTGAGSVVVYLNGVAEITASISTTSLSTGTTYIGYNSGNGYYFAGYISNLRVVNGTAVYTANFTPPVAPLTAITNTALLTLQNATIIDNSTNGFTITNTGTVVTSVQYPFTLAIAADSSPNGNNWTPNNISLAAGSTYDSLTDVPTLTSNTAANYAVLNPLDKGSGMGVTAGNLTATVSSASIVLSSIGVSTGKWYWEMTRNGGSDCVIGIATASVSRTAYLGSDANGWGYIGSNGNKTNTATSVAYGSSYASTIVVGVALDLIDGTVTFYRNNVSQTTAYSNLTDTFFFAAFGTGNSGDSIFANFGQQPFVYTPPSGYLALNTYNLDAADTTTYFAAPISYLVVAGGGAGSGTAYGSPAGGGGAGGYRTAADVLVPSGVALTVTVGAGATGAIGAGGTGTNSSFYRRLSNGGGGGYYYYLYPAGSGGSGGGGGGSSGAGGTGNVGGYSPPEGYAGGNSNGSSPGGGGGAGSAGGTGSAGAGLTWLNGTTYAAGGYSGTPAVNTGGGGYANGYPGGSGASGVVIIRYADSYPAATSTTGSPTIVVSGGFRTYTFTATGTITF